MRLSQKAAGLKESVIREMTRTFNARKGLPGANLAQGFPDFAAPEAMKQAAADAILNDINQYAITWGAKPLREAIATKHGRFYGYTPDPEREITVVCGSTEAMMAALITVIDPGDEVILFEPFYENYGPDTVLSGATPRYVTMHEPDWTLDETVLRAAFNDKTRALILNTPNNPTGKVFSRSEMELISELCQKHDIYVLTDEIYEHIFYEGEHLSIAEFPGMRERTITISGLSKTYSATGWRIGWLIAPPDLTDGIRRVHDFLTVGAAAPLQQGAAIALGFDDAYYDGLKTFYLQKRDYMCGVLAECGFKFRVPDGAYYVMTDFSALSPGSENDVEFALRMIQEAGVATVPGSSFYRDPATGSKKTRFTFCKKEETLILAAELLQSFARKSGILI